MEGRPKEIRWNKERETKLRRVHGKASRATLTRRKKSARELELGASKTYELGALWQRHRERITSATIITSDELFFPAKSGPINRVTSPTSFYLIFLVDVNLHYVRKK